jgi:hypothetical protein
MERLWLARRLGGPGLEAVVNYSARVFGVGNVAAVAFGNINGYW